jgi:polysaccharide biosynthesis protein PslF
MRVLLLSAEYPPLPGGVGDYTLQLGLALRAQDLDVQIATAPQGANPGPLPRHAISGWGWTLPREVRALLRRLRPDLLHIQYQTGAYGMHPAITLLPRALRHTRIPIVVTCHDLRLPYLFPKADLLRRWLTWRLLADASAVVVTNGEDARLLRGELPGDRTVFAAPRPLAPRLIPIGSNIEVIVLAPEERERWRERAGARGETRLLAYFGLSNRSKGVDLLLHALAQLDAPYRLALIGGEAGASDADNRRYGEELLALEGALRLGGRVWRSGMLAAQDVSALLQSCDIAVLPFRDGASYRRGSLLATLAHGLPLITTQPDRALDPPLRDGVEALLLAGDEGALPDQIAAAVRRLAGDAALCARLSQGGRELAAQFGWPAIARQHAELYRGLVRDRRRNTKTGAG